jgi:hypothetical protein
MESRSRLPRWKTTTESPSSEDQMTRKNEKPPHVEAMRRRLEEAAQRQAEAMRTRKDTRSPGRLRGQRLLFETDEQGRFWGV